MREQSEAKAGMPRRFAWGVAAAVGLPLFAGVFSWLSGEFDSKTKLLSNSAGHGLVEVAVQPSTAGRVRFQAKSAMIVLENLPREAAVYLDGVDLVVVNRPGDGK